VTLSFPRFARAKEEPRTRVLAQGSRVFIMHPIHTTKCASRKAKSRLPDLFDWARQNELHTHTSVRTIARRTGVSPAVAAVIAELAVLTTEMRHG
jgi:ribosomal protein L17